MHTTPRPIFITLASSACAAAAGLCLATAASGFAQETSASIWDGVYTTGQAERGEPLYVQGCAECHGMALEGDDMSPPMVGSDFLWDWNGLSLGDMFERIKISMPDGKPRSMTDQEKADVLAYMLRENGIPAGEAELQPKADILRPVAWLASAP